MECQPKTASPLSAADAFSGRGDESRRPPQSPPSRRSRADASPPSGGGNTIAAVDRPLSRSERPSSTTTIASLPERIERHKQQHSPQPAVVPKALTQAFIKGKPLYYWLRCTETDEVAARVYVEAAEDAERHNISVEVGMSLESIRKAALRIRVEEQNVAQAVRDTRQRWKQLKHRVRSDEEEDRIVLYLVEDRAFRELIADEKQKRVRILNAARNRSGAQSSAGKVRIVLDGKMAECLRQMHIKEADGSSDGITPLATSPERGPKLGLLRSSIGSASTSQRPPHPLDGSSRETPVHLIQRVGRGYLLRRGPTETAAGGSSMRPRRSLKPFSAASPKPSSRKSSVAGRANSVSTASAAGVHGSAAGAGGDASAIGEEDVEAVRRMLSAKRKEAFPNLAPRWEFSASATREVGGGVASSSPLSPNRGQRLAPITRHEHTAEAAEHDESGGARADGSFNACWRGRSDAECHTAASASASATARRCPTRGTSSSTPSRPYTAYDRKHAKDKAAIEKQARERRLAKLHQTAATSQLQDSIAERKKFESIRRKQEDHERERVTIRERARVMARRTASLEKAAAFAKEVARRRELDQKEVDEVELHIALRMRIIGEPRLVALKKTLIEVPGAARVASMSASLSLSKAERELLPGGSNLVSPSLLMGSRQLEATSPPSDSERPRS